MGLFSKLSGLFSVGDERETQDDPSRVYVVLVTRYELDDELDDLDYSKPSKKYLLLKPRRNGDVAHKLEAFRKNPDHWMVTTSVYAEEDEIVLSDDIKNASSWNFKEMDVFVPQLLDCSCLSHCSFDVIQTKEWRETQEDGSEDPSSRPLAWFTSPSGQKAYEKAMKSQIDSDTITSEFKDYIRSLFEAYFLTYYSGEFNKIIGAMAKYLNKGKTGSKSLVIDFPAYVDISKNPLLALAARYNHIINIGSHFHDFGIEVVKLRFMKFALPYVYNGMANGFDLSHEEWIDDISFYQAPIIRKSDGVDYLSEKDLEAKIRKTASKPFFIPLDEGE